METKINFETFQQKYEKKPVEHYPNNVSKDVLVSVCVMTYQHSKFIKQCLERILMQKTNFAFEILLGEDNSTDGTREICIEYAQKYPDKIRLFLHHRENNISINGTPTGRFNFLYNIYSARGKYIALCEGDDYWTDDTKLQQQVDFLQKSPQYAGVFHDTQILQEDGTLGNLFGCFNPKISKFTLDDCISLWTIFHTSSFLYRNNCFTTFPDDFLYYQSGDIPLFILVASTGNLKYINSNMSVYRKHSGGFTNTKHCTEINIYLQRYMMFKSLKKFLSPKGEEKFTQVIKDWEQKIVFFFRKNVILRDRAIDMLKICQLTGIKIIFLIIFYKFKDKILSRYYKTRMFLGRIKRKFFNYE